MGEKGYAETRNRPTSQSGATSQPSDFPVTATWPFLFLSCAWLGLAWLVAWQPACSARGLNSRGLAGGWLAGDLPAEARLGPGRRHTAHTHKTHTPPHLERGELCALKTHTPPRR